MMNALRWFGYAFVNMFRSEFVRRLLKRLGPRRLNCWGYFDGTMRVRSLHPGVTLEQAQEASAFELTVTGEVPESRLPTDEERHLIREVFDPNGVRNGEFR